MQTNEIAVQPIIGGNVSDAPPKKTRLRIPLPPPEALAAFLGENIKDVKKTIPDFAYYLKFIIPVSEVIGSIVEANQGHDFAAQLNTQAKAMTLGEVTSVTVAGGNIEVVLTLEVTGDIEQKHLPAANAMESLKEFLGNSPHLKIKVSGRGAKYLAKVNGTTIVEKAF